MPTVAELRKALLPFFPDVPTYLTRLRDAGLLATGKPGRNGVGSASIDTRQVALLLIAIASGADPIDAAAEAQRVGGFKLRRRVEWLPETGPDGARLFGHYWPSLNPPTFLNFVEQAIEGSRAGVFDPERFTFVVGQGVAFDLAGVYVPAEFGGGMLEFSPDRPGKRPAFVTERGIGGAIIAEVVALFGPTEPQELPRELMARMGRVLNLSTAGPGAALG